MKREDTKASLTKAGTNQGALARHLGVSPNYMGRAISSTMRLAQIETGLQKATSKSVLHPNTFKRGRKPSIWNGGTGVAA